jgi:hypothetical protein
VARPKASCADAFGWSVVVDVDRLDLGPVGRGLSIRLRVALARLADDKGANDRAAKALLRAFVAEVRLLERFGRLDDVQADAPTVAAADALARLE